MSNTASLKRDLIFNTAKYLQQDLNDSREIKEIKVLAKSSNSWFDIKESDRMLNAIITNYLSQHKLDKWLNNYEKIKLNSTKTIGIVSAGNIPLAAFHDVWCALACGLNIQIKLSSKDEHLSSYVFNKINEIIGEPRIQIVSILRGIDLMIASGSNLTANHFKTFTDKFPCLVRGHRNSIAILSGDESDAELLKLGDDIFSYYGLGCRNVTKLYIPHIDMISRLAGVLDINFSHVRNNYKYMNNYDYQLALQSLNRQKFYQTETILIKASEELYSAISIVNFEIYNTIAELHSRINFIKDNIQCIATNISGMDLPVVSLGETQNPQLWDYQDQVDVIHFIANVQE
jgi:hypothetical protein